jgi:N-acetylmuramoyl-L-alanine amidase
MFIDIEEDSGRKINLVVLHCSDSPHQHHDDISTIRQWHVEGNGWSDIGYNWYIKQDGTAQKGRPVRIIPAHVRGYNHNSIGICLGGKDTFTDAQRKTLRMLLNEIVNFYNLDFSHVKLHNELDSRKTCPNFTKEWALLTDIN